MIPLGSTVALAPPPADLARPADPEPVAATSPPSRAAPGAAAAIRRGAAKTPAGLAEPARTASSRARRRSTSAGWARAPSTVAGAGKKAAPSGARAGASAASAAAQGAAQASDPLAFLHDSKLSIEEKLMRLLEHLNGRWEKDMQKKLDEMAGHTGQSGSTSKAAGSSSGSSSKGGSFLGKIVEGAKKFFPQVGLALDALKNPTVRAVATKIGGPVLAAAATALGYPALAPALLKYAPTVIDLAAGAASSLGGGSGSASSAKSSGSASSGGSSGAEESSTGLSDKQMQLKLMEVQRIQDAQKEMFALVSNILRSGHELRMSVIGNLR